MKAFKRGYREHAHQTRMQVTKRDGSCEAVHFDKITYRLAHLKQRPRPLDVDVTRVAAQVCASVHDGISTSRLDELAADIAAGMSTEHPDYGELAGRILVSNLQKNTTSDVLATFEKMRGILSEDFLRNIESLDLSFVDYTRDFSFDFFGFKTLEKLYLARVDGVVVERPQHMWLRVAVALWGTDIEKVKETYDYLSTGAFTHASPTLFNAGMKRQQLASCFLTGVEDDSLEGIFDAVTKCAKISKFGGGIGLHVSGVRSKGAAINGTNGTSDGLVPMLRVVNAVGSYVNQCFATGTKVYTRDRGVQPVEAITTDDFMSTVDGTWKKVNQVIINKADDIEVLRLSVKHGIDSVVVTPVHEIYALRGQKRMTNQSVIKSRLEKGTVALEWVPAGDLTVDDMMVFPIPRDTVDVVEGHDYLRMYGIMLGDGHLCAGRKEAGVTLGTTKVDTIRFVREFLASRQVHTWEHEGAGCVNIRWTMGSNFDIPRDDLYAHDGEKRVNPRFMNAPDRKIACILRGLLETDGSLQNEIYFTSSSPYLVDAVRYMCLRIGILTAGYHRDRVGSSHESLNGHITTRKINHVLRIPKHSILWELGVVPPHLQCTPSAEMRFMRWNDMLFTRVVSVARERYTGELFDFNMEDNHNYLTDVGLVHNSGKRKGSIAVYIEPHHPDIIDVLALKRNSGDEHLRARDLFYAVFVSDLFMKRVEADDTWSLFDPSVCPGLNEVWGDEYAALYERYEAEGLAARTLKAQDVWFEILRSQIETGTPYILYKDAANAKSNQQHLGCIKTSNLCSEILEFTAPDEVSVCTLGSLCLPSFVLDGKFDLGALMAATRTLARNLDRVIDITYYPIPEARRSNLRHRPVGIGVQGLQDVFFKLGLPFDSTGARDLNKCIFEAMYFAAISESCELAKKHGAYGTFGGSPASQGKLQFDLWGVTPDDSYSWSTLKEDIRTHGLRNSLSIAPMPTASTAAIFGK